ncbi:MAG: phosphoenolpyruvate synthase [Eubacterium sp.]|nr:phosphoenolpyruvate synthase [Eubacterium sp.]
MAAFDRIESGIPEMDKALDNIRLGDNVVWRVSELNDFRYFMEPYLEQAIRDKRNIIYFRFASHPPLIKNRSEMKTIQIPLSHRFETFTVEIHNEIEKAGRDAFYIFDVLSELQAAWATDLMMGNFFRVTCPFLFILDTVAFFPIIRGKHSVHAINKILNTTQLFFDVYKDSKNIYVRPEKVWNRNSDTMFRPHIYNPETGSFRPILDGVKAGRFYQTLKKAQREAGEQYMDSWDRFFNRVKESYHLGDDITDQCGRMCDIMMTRDEKMRALVKKHFDPTDYFEVRDHMVGTGMIGGKACGMLLARAIIRNDAPEVDEVLEPHDSFYVGSDVYYTYIVDNGFWDYRVRQRTEEGYFELAEEFATRLKEGSFSPALREQFERIVDYYGQDPYIVRSSSILEDGFGNAFAGKYESVFCANKGTIEERVAEFEKAVKTVYASSMNLSALDYRKRRRLDKRDEQMALLVMRVSGTYYGPYYMPCAAGVGYSYSPYRFLESIDPKAGMLRLVMGLGTSAVDRTQGSYPRLVSLDVPERTTYTEVADRHQYSQRKLEVIRGSERVLEQIDLTTIEPELPGYLADILLEHDTDAESRLKEMGRDTQVRFISCRGIVKNEEMMSRMQRMMQTIQNEYDYPVDTEFTINLSDDGEYLINLLQCRPLQVLNDEAKITVPKNIDKKIVFLENKGVSMGLSRQLDLDIIVYVDPVAYYHMPYADKPAVAKMIGRVNWKYRDLDKSMMLIVPGRVGTSSPELGVPVTFSDISAFKVICEVEEKEAGYNPELSYGSHMFQDLVEADILYTAVFANEKTIRFAPELLSGVRDISSEFDEEKQLEGIIKVYDVSGCDCSLYYDLKQEHLLVTI